MVSLAKEPSQTHARMTKLQKNRTKSSLFVWILLMLVLLVAWSVIDASEGSGRPVNGLVTGFQSGKGGGLEISVRLCHALATPSAYPV
jgi:hypothetical protein